jgi:hypothetical protein
MMDFADDFKYFSFELLLDEARKLYRHNKYICDIRLDRSANDEPTLSFYIDKPKRLGLHQLGLPVRFRCMPTRLIVANDV